MEIPSPTERPSRIFRAAAALCVLASHGCASDLLPLGDTYIKESYVSQRWLAFIQEEKSTQTEIRTSLGEPTVSYQEGNILGYRLILVETDRESTLNDYQISLGRNSLWVWATRDPGGASNRWKAYRGTIPAHNMKRQKLSETGTLLVIRSTDQEQRYFDLLSREAEYTLVFVFNESGVLRSYRMLRVRP